MYPAAAAQERPADELKGKIDSALRNLQPPVQVTGRTYQPTSIEDLMRRHKVPAVSVAIIKDGRIAWTAAYGLAKAGQPATPDTLFQAASISKAVSAMGALELVEQRRLKLDAPVNAQLTSWRIPDSNIASGNSVTLRHLLTHTAGLTVRGFDGYERGRPLPSLLQVLNGVEPANSAPVRISTLPGEQWGYSGGGFAVLQQLMTDATGKDFPTLMERLVLKPLGMHRSVFGETLPAALRDSIAIGHKGDGSPVASGYRVQPELAAAGLWTTPSDLARWGISLAAAFHGGKGTLLKRETAKAMLTPGKGEWGLGLTVGGEGEDLRFSHSGVNAGYHSLMIGFPTRREGLVIMTNSDNGTNLFRTLNLAVGQVLGWPGTAPRMLTPAPISDLDRAAVTGDYSMGPVRISIRSEGDRLIATQQNAGSYEIIPMGGGSFLAPDVGIRVEFIRDATGKVTGLSTGSAKLDKISEAAPAAGPTSAVEPDNGQEQEIVVTARKIGIPFWTVSGPSTTMILLPTDGYIPEEATGSIASLTSTLRQADRVLYPGRSSISLSPFKMAGYIIRMRRVMSLPKGTTLADMLPAADYQRLVALKRRGLLNEGFERTHPFYLSVKLKEKAFGEGKGGRGVLQFANQIAKEHKIRRVPPPSLRSKPFAQAHFRSDPREFVPCLLATIDLVEAGRAAFAAESLAWKERRVADVLASPGSRRHEACIPPALRENDRPDGRAEIRALMNEPQVTVALVPLISLAQSGGVLDNLAAAGYTVRGPDWR
jgi:CubicO group peptidase (beta-lactamase class C family)